MIISSNDFMTLFVEYLDEERADLTVQQKHDMVYALGETMIAYAEEVGEHDSTICQLRRMMNNALMNFGGGVY